MYLSKYIAHAGICSRRKAVERIRQGLVTVNGQLQTNPAYQVHEDDQVICDGKLVSVVQQKIYILLHKPRNCLSTCADMQGRTTVLSYIAQKNMPRLYPIGRLDRQTTGVLLLTNDGQLAYTLSHPRFAVPKIYKVTLNKPFTAFHAQQLRNGISLDDGFIAVDTLTWRKQEPTQVTVELHSGRNRIVRRMFAHVGYRVMELDRIAFGGIMYTGLVQGAWRFLTDKEIKQLYLFRGKQ